MTLSLTVSRWELVGGGGKLPWEEHSAGDASRSGGGGSLHMQIGLVYFSTLLVVESQKPCSHVTSSAYISQIGYVTVFIPT